MTGITSRALIRVIGHFPMMAVCFGLVMHVTSKTGEIRITRRIRMTVHTRVPFSIMTAGIDRKILAVVRFEISSIPTGIRRMTQAAICGEASLLMIGIGRRIVISLVTRKTIGWQFSKSSGSVAFQTTNGMSSPQREKIVPEVCRIPRNRLNTMTILAAG